jgi:hypothetical protein
MKDNIKNSLKIITRVYYDYQRELCRLEGQMGIKRNNELKKNTPDRDDSFLISLADRVQTLKNLMKSIEKDIRKTIHDHPLWLGFLEDVKGCGEMMAAIILTEYDIEKATTVSKLWAFTGLSPGMTRGRKATKGKNKYKVTDTLIRQDRRTKGYLCPYNQFLRAKMIGVLGSGFLKANSPYREYYDNMRNRLQSKEWGESAKNPTDRNNPRKMHQHKAAMRYMVKMFLKDLYVAWRTLEGLPVRKPYQEEYIGHKHAV